MIESGTDHKLIKICNDSICVRNKIYGKVDLNNNMFKEDIVTPTVQDSNPTTNFVPLNSVIDIPNPVSDPMTPNNGHHNFFIMGDLNFPDIDWHTITGSNRFSSLFCDLTFDLNLSQLIHHPTHNKGNILDLVLTNDNTLISCRSMSKWTVTENYHYPLIIFPFISQLFPKM